MGLWRVKGAATFQELAFYKLVVKALKKFNSFLRVEKILHFNSTATMIDYFLKLKTAHISKIRRITIRVPREGIIDEKYTRETFAMFPALQLSSLMKYSFDRGPEHVTIVY